jgi:hypothetical protein
VARTHECRTLVVAALRACEHPRSQTVAVYPLAAQRQKRAWCPVDAHRNQARVQCGATAPGEAEPAYVGFDVLVTDNGRVRNVHGFLDNVASA